MTSLKPFMVIIPKREKRVQSLTKSKRAKRQNIVTIETITIIWEMKVARHTKINNITL